MTTKLTLSVDENLVKKAKRVAARKGTSVSKLFEEYIGNLQEKKEENAMEAIRAIMKPHLQKLNKNIPEGADYKELIRQWRYEDYDNKTASAKQAKKLKA